jgi:DNA-directed RNA polymerase subunit RPC12/RpoP
MPYQNKEGRLPPERASKLGHLEVIQSPLVQKLCRNFNDPEFTEHTGSLSLWESLPNDGTELKIIFSTDGSLQIIENPNPPFKTIAFVKSALLRVDQHALSKIDKDTPNPFALRDLMKESALYHSTAFPLRNVYIEGKSNYDAVREIMFESVKDKGLNDSLEGAMMETLKWLVYEKWLDTPKSELEKFDCPHCEKTVATLSLDKENGNCPFCGGKIFITDMFGLHLGMTDDYAPNQVASDYMGVSETLMIFTPIRFYWENKKEILKNCLFVKDGPLSLRATLAKLSAPIRRFFDYAKSKGIEVAMIGQEKSGQFFDHLQLIGNSAPVGSCFIPDNTYIQEKIKHNNTSAVYGADTNYGAKFFVKINDYHKMVINIPTGQRGEFVTSPSQAHLINFKNIIATLPKILSNKFEGALLPIELANKIASLSTYPSAKTLELFADAMKGP